MKNGVRSGTGKSEFGKDKHEHEHLLPVETGSTDFGYVIFIVHVLLNSEANVRKSSIQKSCSKKMNKIPKIY